MKINWRKLNNILHRDVGYFFVGMTIIYSLSGIALNHIDDWDPNYIIKNKSIAVDKGTLKAQMSKAEIDDLVKRLGIKKGIKNHYYPNPNSLKIFLHGGTVTLDLNTGKGLLETVTRRRVFYEVNYLHYNHAKSLWTWFADIFAAGLILLAITGMFVLRGKNGLKRRGVWFVLAGILIPLVFLIMYL